MDQRLASLEQNARQPRLIMEADMPADKKTRERTERVTTAVQAKHRDSCSEKRAQAGPTCSIIFGVQAEPPALPCRDDVLFENGAVAPKLCILLLEMRTPTAAGGLLPTDNSSTATRTTFHQLPLWFCPTEEINLKTSIQCDAYYTSLGWINNQQVPFWPRVTEHKIGAKSGVRSRRVDRSSPRLPVFGNVARVALWGRFALGRWIRLQRFLAEG